MISIGRKLIKPFWHCNDVGRGHPSERARWGLPCLPPPHPSSSSARYVPPPPLQVVMISLGGTGFSCAQRGGLRQRGASDEAVCEAEGEAGRGRLSSRAKMLSSRKRPNESERPTVENRAEIPTLLPKSLDSR